LRFLSGKTIFAKSRRDYADLTLICVKSQQLLLLPRRGLIKVLFRGLSVIKILLFAIVCRRSLSLVTLYGLTHSFSSVFMVSFIVK